MNLQDIVGLVPFALSLNPSNIQRINVDLFDGYRIWSTPDQGQYTLLMKPDIWRKAVQDFVTPPTNNRLGDENPTVEIGAALPLKGYDEVAADDLAWVGFSTKVIGSQGITNRDQTVIYDYTGNAKPSSRQALMMVLRVDKGAFIDQPDPNRSADFRVEMGHDYGRSCFYKLPPEYQDATATVQP
jgi:hypothetical protein